MSDEIRKATWLELFYDLVFVVAIAKAVHAFGHVHDGHIEAALYLKYGLIMVPLWWAWTGHTAFATRFDTDDALQRLMTLAQMACAASLAVFISADFDPNYRGFLLSYAAFRGLLVLMYWRAAATADHDRPTARFLGIGFTVGLTISLTSLAFPGNWKYVVLYLGIAVDLAIPLICRNRLARSPVNEHHLPERYGLLTIILLGESVASLVATVTGAGLSWPTAAAAIAGFGLTASVWWTYSENLESRIYGRALGNGQVVMYMHLMIYLGLGGLANTIRFAIEPNLTLGAYKLLAGISTLLFVAAMLILHLFFHSGEDRGPLLLNAAGFCILVAVALVFMPTHLTVIAALAGLFLAYALSDAVRRRAIRRRTRQPEATAAP